MSDAQAKPLSDAELAQEREWAFDNRSAHGVFDFSTVQSIERRFIATIDADRKELAALRATIARLEEPDDAMLNEAQNAYDPDPDCEDVNYDHASLRPMACAIRAAVRAASGEK